MARCWGARVRVVVAALFVCGLLASPASASTWAEQPLKGSTASGLFAVSCPTTSFCAAVGSGNAVATSTEPGGGSGWNAVSVGAGSEGVPGVIYPGSQIHGIDCPSAGLCVAVSLQGLIYTSTDPAGGAAAWSMADLDGSGPNTHLYDISCPTTSFCAAAASKGRIATSTNPAGGAAAWSIAELGEGVNLRGISCASPSLCVAVGSEGQIASSTNPGGGASAWSVVKLPGSVADHGLYGVACPSAGLCVSGDAIGELLVSTAPADPASAWIPAQSGSTVQITDLDCVSSTQCLAIDNNSDVMTSTNPTGGASAWTYTNVVPYDTGGGAPFNGMFGVSCPTVSFCAMVGIRGRIFTSSDPFSAPPAPAPKPSGGMSKKGKKLTKRPQVTISARPMPGVEINGSQTKVRFRFYSPNHSYVRRFLCKLDNAPMRSCRSPKTYRVGLGRHVFKVRAVGWSGLKGPQESAWFEVCQPTRQHFCAGKPVASGPGAPPPAAEHPSVTAAARR